MAQKRLRQNRYNSSNRITPAFDLENENADLITAMGRDAGDLLVQREKELELYKKQQTELSKLLGLLREEGKVETEQYREAQKQLQEKNALVDAYVKRIDHIKEVAGDETSEYAKQAEYIRNRAQLLDNELKDIEDKNNLHKQQIENYQKEIALIQASNKSRADKEQEILDIKKKQREEENGIRKNLGQPSVEEEQLRSTGWGNNLMTLAGIGNGGEDRQNAIVDGLSSIGDKFVDGIDGIKSAIGTLGKWLSSINQAMDASVKNAVNFLSGNYTAIQANLTGSDIDFEKISDNAVETLGLNRYLEQEKYLTNIRELSDKGLNFNIEERALLQSIADKTVHTFDATDEHLTRIIRILQRDVSTTQFGVEYALRNILNSAFSDTSYLNSLYDSVASAITDATVATGRGDITPFNSTVQTWLGYMYEAGLSDSVVSKLAQGINMLGSGDVAGLASDAALQKLFLLSLDTIGEDYADILQQGLDAETTNKLMLSIIQYLNQIATNTQDNLVLQSAYSDLFNLSISDIKAIQNLSNIESIQILKDATAAAGAAGAALASIESNTLFATQLDTLMSNANYTFGSSIVENNAAYTTYKVSDFLYDIFKDVAGLGGVAGKVGTVGAAVTGVTKMLATVPGIVSLVSSIGDVFEGSAGLANLFGNETGVSYTTNPAGYVTRSSSISSSRSGDFMTSKGYNNLDDTFKQYDESGELTSEKVTVDQWADKNDTTQIEILREFEKTIMTTQVEGETNYAIAVSLEGMSNSVLKSFASIFADEDALLATFTGDNSVITNALFNFTDDTSKDTRRISTIERLSKAHTAGLAANAEGKTSSLQ